MCFDGFDIVPGMGKGVGVFCVCGVNYCISSMSLFLLIDTSLSYFSHSFKIKKIEIWRKLLGQIMEVWKVRVISRDSGSFFFLDKGEEREGNV